MFVLSSENVSRMIHTAHDGITFQTPLPRRLWTHHVNKRLLYDIYGLGRVKLMPKWSGFNVEVTYKRRITCSINDLLHQFEKPHNVINQLARERTHIMLLINLLGRVEKLMMQKTEHITHS